VIHNKLENTKRFLIPILALVVTSIITVTSINTYININMFKKHISKDISKYKEEYLQKNKNDVYKKVHLVNNSIKFQTTKIEIKLKNSLNEKIKIAYNIANDIYTRDKNKYTNEEIKEKIVKHLSIIKFNEGRGYYYIIDNNTNIMLYNPIKKFHGKDVTNAKDSRGTMLLSEHKKVLKNKKVGILKQYLYKPNEANKEYLKMNYITIFEPLNIIIGTGEYLDVIQNKIQDFVIERFSNLEKNKDKYLFFYKLHDINGGDDFATMILNQNRPDLIGKKISDNYKDIKGNKFRKEFLKGLRDKGEVYTKYWYKKPKHKNPKAKMSYFYLNKDWNWIIASGFYFDDLEQHILEKENSLTKYTNTIIKDTIITIVILSLIVIIISVFIALKIDRTIKGYTEQLVENKLQLEHSQKVAKLGSWNLDLTTYKLKWSDEIYNIFKIDKDKFKPSYESFLDAIHPDDKEMVSKAYSKSLEDKKPYSIIHRLLMKDGTTKWVEEKCETTFDKDGNPLISYGTVQDITKEYILRQNQLTQEKLILEQTKNAQMGEMIGNIAHQWRQPLSVISTAATGMKIQKEYGLLSDEEFDELCDGINENAQFLSNTIDTFRDYIKEKKELKEVVLQDRINYAINIIESTIKNSHIKLINNVNNIEPIKITLVVGELSQVIINLFNNAKDALLQNNIDNKVIKIDLVKKDNKAIITIEDNGGGIPNNIISKIFDPYFTTKHKSQGTGLGLHMSRDIIEQQLNGKLYAKNSNDGAVFTIEIPLDTNKTK